VAVYLDPTDANAVALFSREIAGPITMLNLLRLRETADYGDFPTIAPPKPITGRAAYDLYIQHTLPFLRETGGELVYLGKGGDYFVGPQGEGWDLVMLVRQDSMASFLSFASHPEYEAGIGHRTAAVLDSRILPLEDLL
jgi:uncharacterized protein (DUF1330 family)